MGSLPYIVEDCMGFLQLYSDGSVFRSNDIKFHETLIQDDTVSFKDCLYDKKFNLFLRLYKPQSNKNVLENPKLPVVIFLRGGGFCFGSRTWPHVHNCCMRLASGLKAVVITPDYRLSPEHRLPAAVEDAMEAVRWLQRQMLSVCGDAWLSNSDVDFDRVFIVGDSSGGNIAHHLAVRFGSDSREMEPVRIRGYVLLAPFFGGVVRTKSEEGPSEHMLTLDLLDRFWRLSLPVGESRDHPFANPFGEDAANNNNNNNNLAEVKLEPMLVMVGGNELLKDRAQDYANKLKQLGKDIEYVEFEGCQHGFFTHDSYSLVANEVIQVLTRFMLQT